MTGALVDVVGIALPGGPAFVDELRRAWDEGAAVAPIDVRLSGPAKAAAVATLAPTAIVDEDGRRRHAGGRRADAGDALVVATSGTSGTPRAAVITHDAVVAAARATSAALDVDPAVDHWLACLPLAHVGGLSVITRALVTGTPLDVHPGFDPDAVRAAASQATLVSLVPAVLGRIEPAAFRSILLGGSAIPADRPANTVATYGMTETGGGVVYDGRPLDGVEVREVDDEIHLRGPMLLRCYRDGADDVDPLVDGWLATGDAGTVTEGRVTVHGRRDDVIVTGGENVWPSSVEAALGDHPSIAAVAVVGRPDPTWGAVVTAVVETRPGATPPALDDLRDRVRSVLPAWCAPKHLELVAELPRTSLGKIRRVGL